MQRVFPFTLQGGLDLESPDLVKDPGRLISCLNYEPANIGGYSRIQGYERFDGSPSPTDAVYYVLPYDAKSSLPSVGDTILGGTSTATGYVLAIEETDSLTGNIIITKLNGTFTDNENIRNAGDTLTYAVVNGVATPNIAADDIDHKTYTAAAREVYRSDINVVTGSGPIRGVHMYKGYVYAFRDNAGGTAGVMWKSSSVGWVSVDLGGSIEFDTGTTAQPAVGATITQAGSGATGVLIKTIYTGSWSGGTATGRMHLRNITGTFNASGALSFTGGTANTTSTTVNTLPAGGQYEFINYNFSGQDSTTNMYGCNGVGRAFQFDENGGFAYIYTGMTTDEPQHIYAHKSHLFLSFASSVQHSSIGSPLEWDSVTGAGEIAIGDRCTGFTNLVGESLAIFARNQTYILGGSSAANWVLDTHSFETGAVEWSVQGMGNTPKFLDDRGIASLVSIQNYGNFKANTLSQLVEPVLQAKKALLVCSTRSREKNQYRLFFSDNTFLIMRSIGRQESFTVCEYPITVKVAASVEDIDGTERLFFGSDNGCVYEMDKGDSFDGANIEYTLQLSFNNIRSPRVVKRFHQVVFDVDNTDIPDLNVISEVSRGDPFNPASISHSLNNLYPGGGRFDSTDSWGEFYWDGMESNMASAYLQGSGLDLSILIFGQSNYEAPHRIHGGTIHYSIRGLKR